MIHNTNHKKHYREQLLEVMIDYVQIDQAVGIIEKWLKSRGKHYVVTPNPEMLVDAQKDLAFKKALNEADLAIPDSPRLGWGSYIKSLNSPFLKLIYSPFFLLPHKIPENIFPTTTGTDLTEQLISLSEKKAFTTAYLGGSTTVAAKLYECLKEKYPGLKILFCSGNIQVNEKGESRFDIEKDKMTQSNSIKSDNVPLAPTLSLREREQRRFIGVWDNLSSSLPIRERVRERGHNRQEKFNPHTLSQKVDILFVAFGHKKQEKWMNTNLPKLNARVMVGVGGAFDYISGSVPRAPLFMRALGLEWLFRLIIQPWRIRRFGKLFKYVYMIMTSK